MSSEQNIEYITMMVQNSNLNLEMQYDIIKAFKEDQTSKLNKLRINWETFIIENIIEREQADFDLAQQEEEQQDNGYSTPTEVQDLTYEHEGSSHAPIEVMSDEE